MTVPAPLLFLDLETTDLDVRHCYLLEVAAVVTGADLDPVAAGQWAVRPPIPVDTLRAAADPTVRDMHDRNGLWEACKHTADRAADVDDRLGQLLAPFTASEDPPVLAGSGVAAFDRAVMRRWLPASESVLSYRHLDVSSLREAFRRWAPETRLRENNSKHRAMDDVQAALREARRYRQRIASATQLAERAEELERLLAQARGMACDAVEAETAGMPGSRFDEFARFAAAGTLATVQRDDPAGPDRLSDEQLVGIGAALTSGEPIPGSRASREQEQTP